MLRQSKCPIAQEAHQQLQAMLHSCDEQDLSTSAPGTSNPVPPDVHTGASVDTPGDAYTPRRRSDRRRAARLAARRVGGSASAMERRLHPIRAPWSGEPWCDTADDHGSGIAQDVTIMYCGPRATAGHSMAAGQVQPPPYNPKIDGSPSRTDERPPQYECLSPWQPCEELMPNGSPIMQQNRLHDPWSSRTCQSPEHLPESWEVQHSR